MSRRLGNFIGRKVFKHNPASVLGGVTGSMTSGAALSIVTDAAKSEVPALGYTVAYAFFNVILTLASALTMLVLILTNVLPGRPCTQVKN